MSEGVELRTIHFIKSDEMTKHQFYRGVMTCALVKLTITNLVVTLNVIGCRIALK